MDKAGCVRVCIFLCLVVVILGVSGVVGLVWFTRSLHAKLMAASPPAVPVAPPSQDEMKFISWNGDDLAARFAPSEDFDRYKRMRDALRTVYLKDKLGVDLAPNSSDSLTINMTAYLMVWGDFYGEALHGRVQKLACFGRSDDNPKNIFMATISNNAYWQYGRIPNSKQPVVDVYQLAMLVNGLAYDWPVELKLWTVTTAIDVDLQFDRKHHAEALSAPEMDVLVRIWGILLRQAIPTNDGDEVCMAPQQLLDDCVQNPELTKKIMYQVEWAYSGKPSPYLLSFAINRELYAAGVCMGDNSTPTAAQRPEFERHLKAAVSMETSNLRLHPNSIIVYEDMLTICQYDHSPRSTMEGWFNRGVEISPTDKWLYRRKADYLTPYWCGSDQDLEDFIKQCAASGYWAGKIPMCAINAVDLTIRQGNLAFLSRPDVWDTFDSVEREAIRRYPLSTYYRATYMKGALYAHKNEIVIQMARELGAHWNDVPAMSFDEAEQINEILKSSGVPLLPIIR